MRQHIAEVLRHLRVLEGADTLNPENLDQFQEHVAEAFEAVEAMGRLLDSPKPVPRTKIYMEF